MILRTEPRWARRARRGDRPRRCFNLNRELQEAYIQANLDYVRLIQEGGTGEFLGNDFDVVGLAGASGC